MTEVKITEENQEFGKRAIALQKKILDQGIAYSRVNREGLVALGIPWKFIDGGRTSPKNSLWVFMNPFEIAIGSPVCASGAEQEVHFIGTFMTENLGNWTELETRVKRDFPVFGKKISEKTYLKGEIYLPYGAEGRKAWNEPRMAYIKDDTTVYPVYQRNLDEIVQLFEEYRISE
ncbi:MAG: hypothetical protein V1743_00630 [Nanoarchaeota archaeon]